MRVQINFARPPRGDLYVSFRNLQGPINSQVLFLGYNYRMSEKWITNYGTGYDFGVKSNIGQAFSITRIGESFLINLGVVVDPYRNNFSAMINFEPRFLPRHRLGNVAGAQIPIAGVNGLE